MQQVFSANANRQQTSPPSPSPLPSLPLSGIELTVSERSITESSVTRKQQLHAPQRSNNAVHKDANSNQHTGVEDKMIDISYSASVVPNTHDE